jgi:hypothetical protein
MRGLHARIDAAQPMATVAGQLDALCTKLTTPKDRVAFI